MDDTPFEEMFPNPNNTPEPTDVAEQPETIGQPRDEHGRFAAKGEERPVEDTPPEATSGPPPQEPEPGHIPIAALKDERAKRQQLEARLQELEGYLSQQQRPQQPEAPQQAPDMFADPEAYHDFVVRQAVQQALQQIQPQLQQTQTLSRAEVSELLARQKYEDYDEKIEVFKEAMAANPFLRDQLMQAPDPATFAYNAANQWAQAKQFGTSAPLSREQMKAELLEEVKAELGLSNRPPVPTTLAADRSVGSRSGPAWTGPKPFSEMFPR